MQNDFTLANFHAPIYISSITFSKNHLIKIKTMLFNLNESSLNYVTHSRKILNESDFVELKTQIDSHINTYGSTILNSNYKKNICDSWGSLQHPGDICKIHNHAPSVISGIVYLNTTINSGKIIFGSISKTIEFTPTIGQIFIFPGNLAHRVTVNKSQINRYAIAFNYS
jgi:hypothetical protein